MLRTILYLIASVFVIALVRGIIGIVSKGVSDLFREETERQKSPGQAKGFGGELIPCATCGTYSSPGTATKAVVGGETRLFCSAACRDRFAA